MSDFFSVQRLERRRLFAFNTGFFGSVLRVLATGTDPVNISVTISFDSFRITDSNDGSTEDVLGSQVQAISLVGGNGPDVLRVATNIMRRTTLSGFGGNDTFIGGGGADVFIGGSGFDLADFSARTGGMAISLDGNANDGTATERDNVAGDIEIVFGTSGNDTIIGTDFANLLTGNGGNDRILGLGGNDTLSGGNRNDVLIGGAGADVLVGGAGAADTADYSDRTEDLFLTMNDDDDDGAAGEKDTISGSIDRINGGSGDDLITATGRANILRGNAGNDTLRGGGGDDFIFGNDGNDSIFGDGGDDEIFTAGDGDIDTINGGGGRDTLDGDSNDVSAAVP